MSQKFIQIHATTFTILKFIQKNLLKKGTNDTEN